MNLHLFALVNFCGNRLLGLSLTEDSRQELSWQCGWAWGHRGSPGSVTARGECPLLRSRLTVLGSAEPQPWEGWLLKLLNIYLTTKREVQSAPPRGYNPGISQGSQHQTPSSCVVISVLGAQVLYSFTQQMFTVFPSGARLWVVGGNSRTGRTAPILESDIFYYKYDERWNYIQRIQRQPSK